MVSHTHNGKKAPEAAKRVAVVYHSNNFLLGFDETFGPPGSLPESGEKQRIQNNRPEPGAAADSPRNRRYL
jgi:hypothetical protein